MEELTEYVSALDKYNRVVALDLQSDVGLSAINRRFADLLEPINTQLNAIAAVVGRMTVTPILNLFTSDENKALSGVEYMSISKISLVVPEGLNKPMRDYLDALEKSCAVSTGFIENSVIPFERFLADISSKKTSVSNSGKYMVVQSNVDVDIAKANALLGKCFSNGSHNAYSTFGKTFGSIRDYIDCEKRCDALNQWLAKVDLGDLKKRLAHISQLTDTIIEYIDNGKLADVSPINLKYLSQTAYNIGKEVEFFAILLYRIQTVTATIQRAHKIVNEN